MAMQTQSHQISTNEASQAIGYLRRLMAYHHRTTVTRGFVRSIDSGKDPERAGAILDKLVEMGVMEYGPTDAGQRTYQFKPDGAQAFAGGESRGTVSKLVLPPSTPRVMSIDSGTIKVISESEYPELRQTFLFQVKDPKAGMRLSVQELQTWGEPFEDYTWGALGTLFSRLGREGFVEICGKERRLTRKGEEVARVLRRVDSDQRSAPPVAARKPVVSPPAPPSPSREERHASPPVPPTSAPVIAPPPDPPPPPTPPVSQANPWDNSRLRPTLETFAFLAEWAKRRGVTYFNEDTFPRYHVYNMGYSSFAGALRAARRLAQRGLVFTFLGKGTTLVFNPVFIREAEARGLLGDCPDNPFIT